MAAICTGANREPDAVTAKPSPYMLKSIMKQSAVCGERTLMVGDLWSDIAFGHRAGARAVAVLSGVATLEDTRRWAGESVPDGVLHDVRGLVDPQHVVEPLRPWSRATPPPERWGIRPRNPALAAAALAVGLVAATGVAMLAKGGLASTERRLRD